MNDFNKIQNKLLKIEKMSCVNAAIMTADIINSYEKPVKEQILKWVDGEDVSSYEVKGVSVEKLMKRFTCSAFQALCILNGVLKNESTFATAIWREWKDSIH